MALVAQSTSITLALTTSAAMLALAAVVLVRSSAGRSGRTTIARRASGVA